MRKAIFLLTLIALLVCSSLFAGTTGKLTGSVKDNNGEKKAYLNVVLEGTSLGALTDERGRFMILNIPPGTYTLVVQGVGIQPQKIQGVVISVDETTTEKIVVRSTDVQIDDFVINERKQKMVKKGQTGSVVSISTEEIENSPIADIEGLVASKAGAVSTGGEVHVRGGRGNEVGYTVDGMSVSDPVDGGAVLTIDNDAIAAMKVMTGGLTAEYGNAQSGMVTVVTKDGGSEYSGKINFESDHFFGDGNNTDKISGILSGPVLPFAYKDKLTFFFNGGGAWTDGRFMNYYKSNPFNEFGPDAAGDLQLGLNEAYDIDYDPYENRDDFMGFDLGNRNYNTINWNLKTTYKHDVKNKFTLAYRGSRGLNRPYAHSFRYAIDHYAETESDQSQIIFTYDMVLDAKRNLKFKINRFDKTSVQKPRGIDEDEFFQVSDNPDLYDPASGKYGLAKMDANENGILDAWDALADWQYAPTIQSSFDDMRGFGYFTAPGSVYRSLVDDKTSNTAVRIDYQHQLNDIHEIKAGFEGVLHDIKKSQKQNAWFIDDIRWDNYLNEQRMSYEGLFSGNSFYENASNPNIEFHNDGDGNPTDKLKKKSYVYVQNGPGGITAPVDSVVTFYDKNDSTIQNTVYYYHKDVYYDAANASSGVVNGYKANPVQMGFYLQDKMEYEGMIVNLGMRFDYWYLGKDYDKIMDNGSYTSQSIESNNRSKLMVSPRLGISHPISDRDVIHFVYNYQSQLPQMRYIFTSRSPEDAAASDVSIVVGNPDLDPQTTITYEVGLQHQISDDWAMNIQAYYKNTYNYVSTREEHLESDDNVKFYRYISEDYGSARGIDFSLDKRMSNYISGNISYSLAWAEGNANETQIKSDDTDLREFALNWDTRHVFKLGLNFLVQKDQDFYFPGTDFNIPLGVWGAFGINSLYDISSGHPYTRLTEDGAELGKNEERMDYQDNASMTIHKEFGITENQKIRLNVTVNNLFDKRNVLYVYPVTGDPVDDGDTNFDNPQEEANELYVHNVETDRPNHFSSGRTVSVGISYKW
ncbi:MAG: hypothetical protein CSB55_02810 [Candidatus Cloacimonadota bacterium]|nr:MAG: hypothetical protein CSB55_02810 [Candidatus Cloacimonadota bacterium]